MSDYMTIQTTLPPYLPYPRFLLDTALSQTAKVIYAVLLDRATLSQANGWVKCARAIIIKLARFSLMPFRSITTLWPVSRKPTNYVWSTIGKSCHPSKSRQ